MSQDSLAFALGYKSRSTIAKIESGKNDMPLSNLLPLAQALDTTVDSLLSGEEPQLGSRKAGIAVSGGKSRGVAIILAGGKSSRNRQNIPNQYINIHGKPVFLYSTEVYQRHPAIDDIYIVCSDEWEGIVRDYSRRHGISKLAETIPAGRSGIESVRNAAGRLLGLGYRWDDVVVLQESTRPFIREEIISKLLLSCRKSDGSVICEKQTDHVQFLVDGSNQAYLDRTKVVDLQSPEAYTLGALNDLFERAKNRQHCLNETCLSMLMFNLGFKLNFCEGDRNNFKIVRQEDLAVFEALLKSQSPL